MSPQFVLGSFDHTVDDKNRVIVPVVYRSALGSKFFITPSILDSEQHLRLYSEVEYEQLIARLEERIPPNDQRGQRLLRKFYTHTFSVETDAQGRIVLPGALRDLAAIGRRVKFVGRRRYAELWDADVYEAHQRPAEGSLADYLCE